MSVRRTAGGAIALAALAAGIAGCASTGVTANRLNASVAPTFGRLYRWEQKLEGTPVTKALDPKSHCKRDDGSTTGAGSNWICTVSFLIDGANTPVSFNWDVTAKPDGCWSADGVPIQLGGPTIPTPTGGKVPNPIYLVDGCFSAT